MGSKYAGLFFRKQITWLATTKISQWGSPGGGLVLMGDRGSRAFGSLAQPAVRPNSFLGSRWIDAYPRARLKTDGPAERTPAGGDFAPEKPLTGVLFNEKLTGTVLSQEEQAKINIAQMEAESEEERKKQESSWRLMKYSFLFFGMAIGGSMFYVVVDWGAPRKDERGEIVYDEYSGLPPWQEYLYRAWNEVKSYNKMIKDPSRSKLLPDPLTEPYYQPPLTLVLEMTDVLVHPDWTYQTGWRFKKRPGVDFFLQQVGPPLYEVVIYTAEQGFTAFPILDTLDPNGFIMYRLFRDATRYLDGVHVKDLNCLNRDLSKVIMVDWNAKATKLNPQNTLLLKKWDGSDDDKTLVDLAVMLRTIATSGVKDVRDVIQYYMSFPDPIEAFRENQRRLQEEMRVAKYHLRLHVFVHLLQFKWRRNTCSRIRPSLPQAGIQLPAGHSASSMEADRQLQQSREKQAPLARQWMPSFLGSRKL